MTANFFLRVDLSGSARDLAPAVPDGDLALFDTSSDLSRSLRGLLGRFAADPQRNGDWVEFSLQDEEGRRTEQVSCQPATEKDLVGPLKHEVEELDRRLDRGRPADPRRRVHYDFAARSLAPLLSMTSGAERDFHFFKYHDPNGHARLAWCWGYRRADTKQRQAVICDNPECHQLVARRTKYRDRCPSCGSLLPAGRSVRKRLLAAILLLFAAAAVLFWWLAGPTARLEGVIVAKADGRPIAGAEVTVPERRTRTQSDADGQFQLRRLQSGTIRVEVVAEGYVTQQVQQELARHHVTSTRIKLVRDTILTGRVLDAVFSKPIPSAEVTLSDTGRMVRTGASGDFQFCGLPAGQQRVTVAAPGFHETVAHVNLIAHQQTQTEIRLSSIDALNGHVVDAEFDLPIPKAKVQIRDTQLAIETDADGKFSISGVPHGVHIIDISAKGYLPEEAKVIMPTAESHRVALVGGTRISGRITDATSNRPIDDAEILVRLESHSKTFETDSDGRYSLFGVRSGDLRLEASAAEYLSREINAEVESGDVVRDIQLVPAATLAGTVRSELDGQPIPNVEIRILDTEPSCTGATDEAGSFVVAGFPAGKATIHFACNGFCPTEVEQDFPQGRSSLAVQLEPRITLSGTVVDAASSQPVPAAIVSVEGMDSSVQANAQGAFEFPDLPVGPTSISASKPGYVSSRIPKDLRPDGEPMQFRLAREATLTVEVVDAKTARRIGNADVKLLLTPDNSDDEIQQSQTDDDGDGSVQFSHLLAGKGTVDVRVGEYIPLSSEVILRDFAPGENRILRAALTRKLKENEARIVLQWGAAPSDLDSHIYGPVNARGRLHVFYSHQTEGSVNLDVDQTSGYGPETITVSPVQPGVWYQYMVHDFSNKGNPASNALPESQATVRIYGKDSLETFSAHGTQSATVWHVLDFRVGDAGKLEIRKMDRFYPKLPGE